jgi:autotransporter passenger strand-loop-strand repeat protein
VYANGRESIASGVTAIGTVVFNGEEFIASGGTASGTLVKSGGQEVIENGVIASGTVVTDRSRFACGSGPVVHYRMAERTQIQLQAVTHMFFSQAVPVQRSRSARLRLENARRS